MGVIFNRIPKNGSQHYGAYRYYSPNAYTYAQKGKAEPIVIRPESLRAQLEMASYLSVPVGSLPSKDSEIKSKSHLN